MTYESQFPPDERIHKAILAIFAIDKQNAFTSLRVGVMNGVVHLAGVVTSPEVRCAAEELAGSVPGVRGVVNRIEAPGAPRAARTVNLDLHGK